MLCAVESKLSIQKKYFTKEFPEYEIESKWSLLTQNPVVVLLRFVKDIKKGFWRPYTIQKCMGAMPIGIRFFSIDFVFFGRYMGGVWEEVAKAAKSPWRENKYLLAFKGVQQAFQFSDIENFHYPLKRKESRKGDWICYDNMIKQIQSVFPNAREVGMIRRERCSIYITNYLTFRNFCLSADLCSFLQSKLSQVEVEYKGRNGLWLCGTEREILREFELLHAILENNYSDVICPTRMRKFNWIIDCLIK